MDSDKELTVEELFDDTAEQKQQKEEEFKRLQTEVEDLKRHLFHHMDLYQDKQKRFMFTYKGYDIYMKEKILQEGEAYDADSGFFDRYFCSGCENGTQLRKGIDHSGDRFKRSKEFGEELRSFEYREIKKYLIDNDRNAELPRWWFGPEKSKIDEKE